MSPTNQELWLAYFCRVYALMLKAYPHEFVEEFGDEMMIAFRTRARDLARNGGGWALLPFAGHVGEDWLRTTTLEGASTWAQRSTLRWFAALPLAIVASGASMRASGYVAGHLMTGHFQLMSTWIRATLFLAAASFVGVGVWVAPGRRDSVARVAVGVVVVCGAAFIAAGVWSMATTPMLWGGCAMLGGACAYLPWRSRAAKRAQR